MPKGPRFRQASRETLDLVRCRGVEQLSQGSRAWTKGTRCQPDLPGESCLCPSARGVDQQSRATRARVPGPARSTRCLWRLRPGSEGRRVRPGHKGDWRQFPRSRGSTRYPGLTGSAPRACGVDQLSRATRACVQRPAGSTSCPRRLGHGSEGPRVQSALPATRARIRGPVVQPDIPGDSG